MKVPDELVEAVAKAQWDQGWRDDQGMADWETAKRIGLPGVQKARESARRALQAVLPKVREQLLSDKAFIAFLQPLDAIDILEPPTPYELKKGLQAAFDHAFPEEES